MFTRIKKVKNSRGELREYLLLVENHWDKGKVRQKTIANLGRLDIIKKTQMADVLIVLKNVSVKSLVVITTCKHNYFSCYLQGSH